MNLISEEETIARYAVLDDSYLKGWSKSGLRVPSDVTSKLLASEVLVKFLGSEEETCLLITERGIWISSEDPFLFEYILQKEGCAMPYEWHFGLTFGREEAKLLQGVAFLCLSNIWGFKCLNRSQQIVIEFDHHEEMWLYAATQQELDDLISSEVMPSHDRFEPI